MLYTPKNLFKILTLTLNTNTNIKFCVENFYIQNLEKSKKHNKTYNRCKTTIGAFYNKCLSKQKNFSSI